MSRLFQRTYNKRSRSPSPFPSHENEKDQPKKVGKITIDQNMCIVQVVSSEQMRTIAATLKDASTTTSSTASDVDYTDTEIGRDTPENHDQFESMHESIEETVVNLPRSSYMRYSQVRTRSQSKSRDCSTRAIESERVNRRSRSNSSSRACYQESESANRKASSNSRECSQDRSKRLYNDNEVKLTLEHEIALQKNPTIFEVSNSEEKDNANSVCQGPSQSNSCNIDNVQNVGVIKVNVKPNILSRSFQILFLACLFFFPCYYDVWRPYTNNIVWILVSLSVLLLLFANLCTLKVYFPRMFGEVNPYKNSSIET